MLMTDINLEAAQKGAALIQSKLPNAKVLAVKTDVGKEDDIKAAVATAVKEFGRLDVMVRDRTNPTRITPFDVSNASLIMLVRFSGSSDK